MLTVVGVERAAAPQRDKAKKPLLLFCREKNPLISIRLWMEYSNLMSKIKKFSLVKLAIVTKAGEV